MAHQYAAISIPVHVLASTCNISPLSILEDVVLYFGELCI